MKLFWEHSELELKFTLTDEEKSLLLNRTNTNKLGFAILMKFVQYERRFPNKIKEIPILLIKYISEQLKIPDDEFKKYNLDLKRREMQRQRAIIRKFYNVKEWYRKYEKEISEFLNKSVLPHKLEIEDIRKEILNFLYNNSIEPPSQKYIGRMISSILNFWENKFFEHIYTALSSQTKKQMYNLLTIPVSKDDIKLSALRYNFGTVSVATLQYEAEKLEALRKISLKEVNFIFI